MSTVIVLTARLKGSSCISVHKRSLSPKERSLRSPTASAGSPHAEHTVDPTTQLEVFLLHCTLTRSLIPLEVFDVLRGCATCPVNRLAVFSFSSFSFPFKDTSAVTERGGNTSSAAKLARLSLDLKSVQYKLSPKHRSVA